MPVLYPKSWITGRKMKLATMVEHKIYVYRMWVWLVVMDSSWIRR
jgi:hypothetical protein